MRYLIFTLSLLLWLGCANPDKLIPAGSPGFAGTGEQIRRIRLEQKMTLEALAKAIDMQISNLSIIEDGMADPTPEMMVKIQEVLGKDIIVDGK